jgi:hypothetical protein
MQNKNMKNKLVPDLVLYAFISLLLVAAGHLFILQRSLNGATGFLTIGGDSFSYITMIEGNWSGTPSPFRFRVLVPLIASLAPFSPVDALRFITYASLFASYILILLICSKAGLDIKTSVIGLVAVWSSMWHFYFYYNPYLTDAFGLMAMCIMIYAAMKRKFVPFLIAVIIGTLARETVLFLAPVWFVTKENKRGVIILIAGAIVFLAPRYFLAFSDPVSTLSNGLNASGVLQNPAAFVGKIFYSWGFVWITALIGMIYLPNETFKVIFISFLCMLLCGVATSLFATDTTRMFNIFAPVWAVSTAQFYNLLVKEKQKLSYAFATLIISQIFVSFPNILTGEESFRFGFIPRLTLYCAEAIFVCFTLISLRSSITATFRQKTEYMKNFGKEIISGF